MENINTKNYISDYAMLESLNKKYIEHDFDWDVQVTEQLKRMGYTSFKEN
jgi:hypothetical protein